MKEIQLIRLVAILLVMNITKIIYAQDETVTTSKAVEDSIDYNYQRKYEYLSKNFLEEKSLLKVGAKYILFYNPDLHANYWSPGFLISYERKLSPAFSFSSELNYHFSYDSLSVFGLSLQGRYYRLKNKEIRNNTGADNMIGPYILFGVQDIISYRSPLLKTSSRKDEFGFFPLIQLGIGNQIHINKWINFDFNFYANYDVIDSRFGCRIEGNINFVLRGEKTK
jgi:hypothetical protein